MFDPKPSPAATYERARRFANVAMWTLSLQCRRLKSEEPEDQEFILRKWSDINFLLVALTKLKRAALLAQKVNIIKSNIKKAVMEFNKKLP